MDKENLASSLFFSKEAADYLGITTQRLNILVQQGKLKPLKKNSSGTIFHISELERRREELSIFEEKTEINGDIGMFRIDNPAKSEALNFSVLMLSLNISEKKLNPIFDEFASKYDISADMIENISPWSIFFKVSEDTLRNNYSFAKREFEKLNISDEIIKIGDPFYPKMLSITEEAPRFLFLRGNKNLLLDNRTVALVGSRGASIEGQENARRVAKSLGRNGIIVVSGLAKGIDVSVHKAALENNFNTIAVIGTNLNQYYPNENKDIQKEIEKKGLVISQFSPVLKTERWFFPLRNGVMSGLSLATVIIEAGETSGALKQATFALKQKRLVLIPQNAFNIKTITWPEKLRQKGAFVVRSPKEIIEKLSENNVYVEKEEDYEKSDSLDLFNNFDHDLYVAEMKGIYSADKSK